MNKLIYTSPDVRVIDVRTKTAILTVSGNQGALNSTEMMEGDDNW